MSEATVAPGSNSMTAWGGGRIAACRSAASVWSLGPNLARQDSRSSSSEDVRTVQSGDCPGGEGEEER